MEETTENDKGFVYFIQQISEETGEEFYKVGFTKNLEKRLRELKTGNPNSLKIKFYIPECNPSFERYMHLLLDRFRLSGEWFKPEGINFLLEKSSPWFMENMLRYSKKNNDSS